MASSTIADPSGAAGRFDRVLSRDARAAAESAYDDGSATTRFVYDSLGRVVETHNANRSAATTRSYDAGGRVASTTNARGQRIDYQYDVLDRVVEMTSPGGSGYAFEYDPATRQTSRVERYPINAAGFEAAIDSIRLEYAPRAVAPSLCAEDLANACVLFFGCGCADGQCSGAFCLGTGCSAPQRDECTLAGCGCVDGRCEGGECAGTACTARQALDCAAAGCGCYLGQCSGGECD